MWEGSELTLCESTQGVVNHRGELAHPEVLHAALPEMAELGMRLFRVLAG